MDKGRYREELRALEESCKPIDEAVARQSVTSEDAFPSAIKWTGKNLREVIDLTGWNESASSKWTWAEYEQVVEEKGLKIFTPSGSVVADIGDWIIYNGKDYYVTAQKNKSATSEEVAEAIEQLKYAREQDREFDDGTFVDSLDLAITALQAYQPWVSTSKKLPECKWVAVKNGRGGHECGFCCEYAPSYQDGTEWLSCYCPNCGRKIKED